MDLGEVPPTVEVDLDLFSIPPAAKHAITDIVLESISNVLAHACATTLRVTIWLDDQRIFTEIEDNGIGGVTSLRKVEDRTRAHSRARSRSTVHEEWEHSCE